MKISTKLSLSALAMVAMSAGMVSAQGSYGVSWSYVDAGNAVSAEPTSRVAIFVARQDGSAAREVRGVNSRIYYNSEQTGTTGWLPKPGSTTLIVSPNHTGAADAADSDSDAGTNWYSLGAITYTGGYPLAAIDGSLPAGWTPGTPAPGVWDIAGIWEFSSIPSPVNVTGNPATASGISDGAVGAGGGATTVPLANVVGFSNSGTPGVLAVELADFSAKFTGTGALVTWETALEIDNAGFNLYEGTGHSINKLNPILIGAAGTAASYSYADNRPLGNGEVRTYWLEDVDVTGLATTLHGPAVVWGGASSNVLGWDLY
jgi:hypothetical protein